MASFRSRTFTEYLQIIWRRKLLIFLITTGMLISTFLIIDRLPNVYESQATVVISGQQGDRQAINSRVAAARESLTSRAFLEPVAQSQDPYGNAAKNIEAAINRLRKDIKVDTFYRSDFPERLSVAYRHQNPTVAKAVATDLVSLFDNLNKAVEKQVNDDASKTASEIAEVENRLREMGKLRAAISARRRSVGRSSGEMSAIRAQRLAAASTIETLTDKQFALQQQIEEQKRQIAEQQKIVKTVPSDARATSSYGVLLVRKAELEAQLAEYSTQYTDKNPKVIQTRNQLNEINRQIAQLSAGGGQEGAAASSAEARELRGMQRELARLQTELAVTERALARKQQSQPASTIAATTVPAPVVAPAPEGETPPEMQTDYETLRRRYDSLLDRQEQLQRAQVTTAGLEAGIFQIVDMPAEPNAPVGPNRFKYKMFAIALALGIALLVAIAIEIPKLYSIVDDRDVEYYLGVPVIALIPETVAPTEGRRGRLLMGRTVGLLLAALLIAIVLLLLNQFQVFTRIATLLR
jgi:uncharacterized protein involved in exopolysaccharide biosynthesis